MLEFIDSEYCQYVDLFKTLSYYPDAAKPTDPESLFCDRGIALQLNPGSSHGFHFPRKEQRTLNPMMGLYNPQSVRP